MVVNFRTREISRGTHKLARTFILIIKKPTILPSRSQTINLFYIPLQYINVHYSTVSYLIKYTFINNKKHIGNIIHLGRWEKTIKQADQIRLINPYSIMNKDRPYSYILAHTRSLTRQNSSVLFL
jgi:hypothetical protein